jgi:hypothetical protein
MPFFVSCLFRYSGVLGVEEPHQSIPKFAFGDKIILSFRYSGVLGVEEPHHIKHGSLIKVMKSRVAFFQGT